MVENTKNDDFYEEVHDYISNNPEAIEVWLMAIRDTEVFEKKHGFTRRQVCEGLFKAALDLAYWRDGDSYFQKPDEVRGFYTWALGWLNKTIANYITPEKQRKYEAKYGKNPDWLFKISNFDDSSTDEIKN